MEEEDFRKSIKCLNEIMSKTKELLIDIKEGKVDSEKLNKIKENVTVISQLKQKFNK